MAFTKEDQKKLDETHDTVIQLKTVILGTNSDKGLAGWVEELDRMVARNTKLIYVILGLISLTGVGFGVVNFVFP